MDLSQWERQLPLFQNGAEDQLRLSNARITVVGAGGLGSAVLYYLAASGVNNLQIIDNQAIELSNLNRQILYNFADVGKKKVEIAAGRLIGLNPKLNVEAIAVKAEEAVDAIQNFQPEIIVDGTDNLGARIFLNRLSLSLRIPLVYAAVEGWQGLVGTVYPFQSSCFECVFGEKLTTKKTPPVIGTTPGLAGVVEAAVAIKILLGDKPLYNQVLFFDLNTFSFKLLKTSRKSGCHSCEDKGLL
jgi:adenylyltransferase/sulfurtransferase